MKQVKISIPDATITYNYLYEDMPLAWREEDLLYVCLPQGKTIDVGWYPACDPGGQFKVTLSDGHQNRIKENSVDTLEEVASAVERLAVGAANGKSRDVSVSIEHVRWQSRGGYVHALSSSAPNPPREVLLSTF